MKIVRIPVEGMVNVADIPNTLESLQKEVGGYIDYVSTSQRYIKLVVNDEGLIYKLKPNTVASHIVGRPIVGNAVLTRVTPDGDNTDLTHTDIEFLFPEGFE